MMNAITHPTESIDLIISNIISLHPVQLSFLECGRYLNYNDKSCYVARTRGSFPVRVRAMGGKLICQTVDLIEYIKSGVNQSKLSDAPIKPKIIVTGKAGRPTKREQFEAAEKGITVSELRNGGVK